MITASEPPSSLLRERATWRAAVFFAALTIVLAYPISIQPASLRFPTGPDGDLGWYLLGWDVHALVRHPWSIFDANIYYPERLTLAYGENVIGLALLAAPVIWLGGNLLLAANVVSLLSTALCGLGAYVLARRVGLTVAAALICGIIFQCSPPRFLRIGQMNLSSVQWIPFTLAALHAYVDRGRRSDLRWAAAFTSLQVLSSGHGAVFLAVTLFVFFLHRIVIGEPLRVFRWIRDLGATGAGLLLPAILVFIPYRVVQREVGLKRGLGTWIADYQSFLASPSHVHRALLEWLGLSGITANASAYLFPGYLPLALAVLGIVWMRRRNPGEARWWRSGALLRAAVAIGAVVAAALTVGTLVNEDAGTARAVSPATASAAWLIWLAATLLTFLVERRAPGRATILRRMPFAVLSLLVVAWLVAVAVRPSIRAGDGLLGEYFANPAFEGEPAFTAADTEFSTARMAVRWNGPPPGQFAVRWMGFLTVSRAGLYDFALTSDDEAQLVVDNRVVVENADTRGLTTRTGSAQLARGTHAVALRYVQFGGGSALEWAWAREGAPYTPVPAWALSQRKTTPGTVQVLRAIEFVTRGLAFATLVAAVWYVRGIVSGQAASPGDIARRPAGAKGLYIALTAGAVWLALGPPYGVWRFVYWLPGFSFIRANSRFSLVALLGVAVLAALGFDKLAGRLSRTGRLVFTGVLALLLVAEFAITPLAVQPSNLEIPAIDRWLDTRAKPFVVAEVPVYNAVTNLGAFERQQVKFMIHSTAHWQKTVHGYSGWRTDFHRELYAAMEHFPDDRSLAALSDVGVTYVVVHVDDYAPGDWAAVEERLRRYASRLRLEHVEGSGRVYALAGPR